MNAAEQHELADQHGLPVRGGAAVAVAGPPGPDPWCVARRPRRRRTRKNLLGGRAPARAAEWIVDKDMRRLGGTLRRRSPLNPSVQREGAPSRAWKDPHVPATRRRCRPSPPTPGWPWAATGSARGSARAASAPSTRRATSASGAPSRSRSSRPAGWRRSGPSARRARSRGSTTTRSSRCSTPARRTATATSSPSWSRAARSPSSRRRGELSDRDVLRIGLALADALAHAHERGVDPPRRQAAERDRPRHADLAPRRGEADRLRRRPPRRRGRADAHRRRRRHARLHGAGAGGGATRSTGAPTSTRSGSSSTRRSPAANPVRAGSPSATARRIGTGSRRSRARAADLPARAVRGARPHARARSRAARRARRPVRRARRRARRGLRRGRPDRAAPARARRSRRSRPRSGGSWPPPRPARSPGRRSPG